MKKYIFIFILLFVLYFIFQFGFTPSNDFDKVSYIPNEHVIYTYEGDDDYENTYTYEVEYQPVTYDDNIYIVYEDISYLKQNVKTYNTYAYVFKKDGIYAILDCPVHLDKWYSIFYLKLTMKSQQLTPYLLYANNEEVRTSVLYNEKHVFSFEKNHSTPFGEFNHVIKEEKRMITKFDEHHQNNFVQYFDKNIGKLYYDEKPLVKIEKISD